MSVLVTHAHNRVAYLTTRCLAKHGIKVTCASEFPLAATFFSRYCTSHFTYPSPWKQPEQFVEKIVEEIERRDIEVLMPVHHEGYVLSEYKDILDSHVRFPYPSYSKIVAVSDKARLTETATQAGVRTPKTIVPYNLDQVEETKSHLHFPVLVKLRRGHGGIGQVVVKDPSDLTTEYLKTLRRFNLSSKEDYPIIQEFISGKKLYTGMLFNHGEMRAKFSHRTVRQYTSASYRFEYEDPTVTSALENVAQHTEWHGIISGDFIMEDETNTPYLTDVNPRFWGSIYLAILSGVEFPYLLYRMAVDGDVEPVLEYSRDLEAKWFLGEIACLSKYIVTGDREQIFNILTCRAPVDCWDWGDLTPFFALPVYHLNQLLRYGTIHPLTEKRS